MSDWWSMGGYEFYVWTSYALFAAVLSWDFLLPRWRERNALRAAAMKQKRLAARNTQ